MSSWTMTSEETLCSEICCACHVLFAMPKRMQDKARETGSQFFCPNGHGQHYAETEVAKLRKDVQLERQARDQAEARARDLQIEKEKVERRLKHGVCPCCRRTFGNLQRHMATRHPEFGPPPLNMPAPKIRKRRS